MLLFDMYKWDGVGLECGVTIDGGEHCDLGVGTFLNQSAELGCGARPPINGEEVRIEAMQLREFVLGANGALDRSCMCVGEGVSVVGCEEVMRDALGLESVGAEPRPHPLAEAGLEMMRTPAQSRVYRSFLVSTLWHTRHLMRPLLKNS